MKFVKLAKTSEASTYVKRLKTDLDAHKLAGKPLPPSTQITPKAGSCCGQPSDMCRPDPSLWDKGAWKELNFSVDRSHRYSYHFEKTNDKEYVVRAIGDLDCDGVFSTFEMTHQSDALARIQEHE